MRSILRSLLAATACALLATPALAQWPGLTLPPSGDNQKATVTQHLGLVTVSVDYSSPDVHGPNGEDRTGKIWGELVPWGMANLGFGTCGDQCPWRGGANENTVLTVSHDVQVEGQPLPAGRYGLHFLPGPEEWTVIFSTNSTSWGSYTYDAKEDALRVKVAPRKNDYREWLTYEFTDRRGDRATLALMWENLAVPFTFTVPDPVSLYVEALRRELRSSAGFTGQNLVAASQYCLQNQTNLAEALTWARNAADPARFGGAETFTTLSNLAALEAANGLDAEAKKTTDKALSHPTATAIDIHGYARQLQAQGKQQQAMDAFLLNAQRHPDQWPVAFGLARGYAGLGKKKEAIEQARKALAQAPDEINRRNIEAFIKQLGGG